jgi:YbbR domain-containing protein
VTITGPESLVDLVDAAVAEVDLTGLSVDIDRESVPLDLRDARGGDISGVTAEPAITSVSVDLLQKEYSLAFVVSPTIRGEPATGYNVTGIAIDPRLVIISGPLDVLQSIDAVRGIATAEISIADSRGDVSRVVQLTLPDGARVQGSADVSVRVSIAPAKGEYTFRVAPSVRNVGGGLVASQPEPVSVTLAGDVPALEALTAASISLIVDAQGLAAGLHALPLQIEPPGGTTVVRIDPGEVGIALSAQ